MLLYLAGIISQSMLFQLTGVSFFSLYGLSIIAFIKVSTHPLGKLFGVLVLLLVVIVMYTFGTVMIYPIVLFVLGAIWVVIKTDRGVQTPAMNEV